MPPRLLARSAVTSVTLAGLALTAVAPADAMVRPRRPQHPRVWTAASTATPTVVKTPTPKPTPTPTPAPTAEPSAPSPSPNPSPTATATATATPVTAPTPSPTLSPTPTATTAPEPSPDPTPQPAPQLTPAPAPAPTPTPTATTPPPAPSGQTTTAAVIPASSLTFPGPTTGWTSYAGGIAGFSGTVGRTDAGALSVTSAGTWTGAVSPTFPVVPGARYTASGFALSASGASTMALGLRFRTSAGALIASGNQVGQGLPDNATTWSPLSAVIGFAPTGAARGEVVVLSTDAPAGQVNYLDDVSVMQTTGTAAPLVAPLTTSGRDVLDALGRRVTFRGIHLDGMQWSSSKVVGTDQVFAAQKWGANFVRLPLSENFATPGDCSYDSTYLSRVDGLVDAATSRGLFLMIDLHTNALMPCATPAQQSMPDAGAVQWWQMIATRYKSNPLVGFDLYNEPHDVSDTVWRDGGSVTSGGVTYTAAGMQSLYDAVRGTGATNLVFASGNNWANTFPAGAPLTGTSNLIYAVHAYTCPHGTPESGATCTPGPNGVLDPSTYMKNFAGIALTMPVMVTEFGWPNKSEGRYIANVIDNVTARAWVGWDVFAFDGTNSGQFDLVKDTGPVNDPAISGMAAMTRMLTS